MLMRQAASSVHAATKIPFRIDNFDWLGLMPGTTLRLLASLVLTGTGLPLVVPSPALFFLMYQLCGGLNSGGAAFPIMLTSTSPFRGGVTAHVTPPRQHPELPPFVNHSLLRRSK